MTRRFVFKDNDTVQVFRLGTTTNAKIVGNPKEVILQSYTFSKEQFEFVTTKSGMKEFFSIAGSNCLDCPFNSFGKCYTHKFNQYVGFISMLKSIAKDFQNFFDIPLYSTRIKEELMSVASGRYVRFGTYGEPSKHPIDLISGLCSVARIWTGYTHQWFMRPDLAPYFMASVHSEYQAARASNSGWRSFIASAGHTQHVNCPASKEAGYKSTCDKCGLCSGMQGKGKKSIYILLH